MIVRVCPYCSNVDVDKLKEVAGEENVSTGCIGQCRAYKTEAVAKIDGQIFINENQEKLFDYILKIK